ncbi:hypothetical protein M8C21_020394 [Ambrosia artemisiifolia]|uniref:Uncharacterized protein n=1 Tax=Ambrosia artemisiifolia TaxID=4212 RepID=A0AAD5D0K4_AMBAR|nr:hypothetical protein M8C21_020394 [Ambrosia artemisiifolia]
MGSQSGTYIPRVGACLLEQNGLKLGMTQATPALLMANKYPSSHKLSEGKFLLLNQYQHRPQRAMVMVLGDDKGLFWSTGHRILSELSSELTKWVLDLINVCNGDIFLCHLARNRDCKEQINGLKAKELHLQAEVSSITKQPSDSRIALNLDSEFDNPVRESAIFGSKFYTIGYAQFHESDRESYANVRQSMNPNMVEHVNPVNDATNKVLAKVPLKWYPLPILNRVSEEHTISSLADRLCPHRELEQWWWLVFGFTRVAAYFNNMVQQCLGNSQQKERLPITLLLDNFFSSGFNGEDPKEMGSQSGTYLPRFGACLLERKGLKLVILFNLSGMKNHNYYWEYDEQIVKICLCHLQFCLVIACI